jgi:hypothetical protein
MHFKPKKKNSASKKNLTEKRRITLARELFYFCVLLRVVRYGRKEQT